MISVKVLIALKAFLSNLGNPTPEKKLFKSSLLISESRIALKSHGPLRSRDRRDSTLSRSGVVLSTFLTVSRSSKLL